MPVALASPCRIKRKRHRWRRAASGRAVYAYVGGNPLSRYDPRGLAYQVVVGINGTVIAPGGGASASIGYGYNLDGWNSTVYYQAQLNVGAGGGGFAGYGLGLTNGHTASGPSTGFDSQKYAEADAGLGLDIGGSMTENECHAPDYGFSKGIFGKKFGEGGGAGAFAGQAYTATVASPSPASIGQAIVNAFEGLWNSGALDW